LNLYVYITDYYFFKISSFLLFQAFDLLQISLRDPSEKVQRTALHVFLPSFAAWAYELGRLEHQLVHAMLRDLEDLVKAIYICSGVGLLLTPVC
jgi:hypothetical protein